MLPAGLGGPDTDWQPGARCAPAETRWVGPLPVDPGQEAGRRERDGMTEPSSPAIRNHLLCCPTA
ncbi:hypothetical protein [Actinoplanes sp. URMC 104]|uniref:hypothetical protein n=1 Tax=Actinoplanes sp. URMC 104 TaxID=3423409 RepID=UPI003F1E1D51